jgi:hypothetical protein
MGLHSRWGPSTSAAPKFGIILGVRAPLLEPPATDILGYETQVHRFPSNTPKADAPQRSLVFEKQSVFAAV